MLPQVYFLFQFKKSRRSKKKNPSAMKQRFLIRKEVGHSDGLLTSVANEIVGHELIMK